MSGGLRHNIYRPMKPRATQENRLDSVLPLGFSVVRSICGESNENGVPRWHLTSCVERVGREKMHGAEASPPGRSSSREKIYGYGNYTCNPHNFQSYIVLPIQSKRSIGRMVGRANEQEDGLMLNDEASIPPQRPVRSVSCHVTPKHSAGRFRVSGWQPSDHLNALKSVVSYAGHE